MTIDDINIDSKFRLRALRDDYIHAFVTYFVVEFTACPQRTVINTGMVIDLFIYKRHFYFLLAPGAGYTHWKQTVFYFPDYATMKQDEILEGQFSCKVNLENTVCRKTIIEIPIRYIYFLEKT
jgi:protein arginine N-methyltransferase 1